MGSYALRGSLVSEIQELMVLRKRAENLLSFSPSHAVCSSIATGQGMHFPINLWVSKENHLL